MLAARLPWARTCICCREMEVVGPAGTEAEVNAFGLMTDSRGSAVESAHPQTLARTHLHSYSVSTSLHQTQTII